jgi:hypothetical protein
MEMTRRQLLLLTLSAVPACAKGVLDWKRDTLLIADHLDRLHGSGRFYSIQPEPVQGSRGFHGHPIRGQAALRRRDTDLLLNTLSKSLRRGAQVQRVYECFDPHHGLRVEHGGIQADLLICFECEQLYYFARGKPLLGYLSGGREVFEEVARAYGLPAAPGPTRRTPLAE